MPDLCRLVIIPVSEQEETSACTMALLAALRSRQFEVQHFRSLAAFTPTDYVTPLTGIGSRHLDPWIMSEALCRELFVHSATPVDVSIIEACRDDGPDGATGEAAGWREIARMLNAPVVGVVRSQAPGSFHAPPLPDGTAALLIDGCISREHFAAEKAALETMCHVPVLGGLPAGNLAGECVAKLRTGRRIPGNVSGELAAAMLANMDVDGLMRLGRSRPFPGHSPDLFSRPDARSSLRVAVAYDECFHCYFPDTLDALEFLGAELCMFSPLANEGLPEHTDIVYLGCGHPDSHAQELAANECMRAALHDHVCSGRRVYAEGGAAAYLCRQLRLATGRTVPMVGIFPAEARVAGGACGGPRRVELECRQPTWIADRGQSIRGYANGRWQIVPLAGVRQCFSSGSGVPEGIVRHHCVASLVHLNFAAQPRVLDAFFAPHAPSLSISMK